MTPYIWRTLDYLRIQRLRLRIWWRENGETFLFGVAIAVILCLCTQLVTN